MSRGKPRLLDLFCGAGGAAMGYGPECERAWAAGFFDGEGSVSAYRDKRPGRAVGISLSIEQTDPRPLQRFLRATKLDANLSSRPPRAPNRKVLYRLFITNGKVVTTMQALWPFLSEPKREQFLRVLEEAYGEAQTA